MDPFKVVKIREQTDGCWNRSRQRVTRNVELGYSDIGAFMFPLDKTMLSLPAIKISRR